MNIIVGATGQVGAQLIRELKARNLPVSAVARNPEKFADNSIEIRVADLFNGEQLISAFEGGSTVFLLTPENPASNDIIGETKQIVQNYREAILATGIKKVIGLSCVGAQVEKGTGNILMSRILEQGFEGLELEKAFVRPSYYFSNWLGFMESIEQVGVMPTFFPEGLKIDMNSPVDVAKFVAEVMANDNVSVDTKIFELAGPEKYSSSDVAATFSKALNKEVVSQSIPKEKWNETLLSAGFTKNTSSNLVEMTQAVIDNTAAPENKDELVKLPTTLLEYLKGQLV